MDLVVHQASQREGISQRPKRFKKIMLTVFKGDNWNDLLKEVVTFDSVEEFWGVYVNHSSPYLCTQEDLY